MVEKKSNPFGWFAHGPFGPWGRKLGFRWAFPIGTLAVPFHPLILPGALLGIIGWTAWSVWQAIAGAGGLENSIMMLILALGLGLLMSIPVLCWFVFALGGRLVQSVLFLAAMILIAVDCWQGQISIIWAVLPGAYVGLFVVQLLLGTVWLRRIEREAANFVPQDQGQDPVALARFNHSARDLVTACAIPSLFCPPLKGTIKAKHYHWLTEDDARDLTEAMGEGQVPGWKFEPRDGAVLLVREDAAPPRSAILLQEGKLRTPLWLVIGLSRIEAKGCGRHWRLTYGDAMTVQPIPLMNLFRFTSISGSHYNQLVAGFPRRKAATLTKPEVANTREFTLLFPPRESSEGPFEKDGLAALYADIAAHKRQQASARDKAIANIESLWGKLAQGKETSSLDHESMGVLREEPGRFRSEQAEVILDWLERARDDLNTVQLLGAARLLEAVPDEMLEPHSERLETIFNSQSLALQWEIRNVIDRKPLPRKLPLLAGAYGGLGLFLSNPSLYAKLAHISPKLREVESYLQRRLQSGEPGLCTKHTFVVTRRRASKKGARKTL